MTEVTAICRFCHATCGLVATLEDGRITKLIGDLDNPMYTGYSCIKGRNYHEFHASPDRILKPLRRNAQADFESVASGEALAEIVRPAVRLAREGFAVDEDLARDLAASSTVDKLNAAAKTGSLDNIQATMAGVGGTCKTCHDAFRKD